MDNIQETPANITPEQKSTEAVIQKNASPSKKAALYITGGILLLLLIGFFLFTQKQIMNRQINRQPAIQPSQQPLPTLSVNNKPGIITKLSMGTTLDANGNVLSPTNIFATSDKTIYLVLTFTSSKTGTKFEYIR